MAQTFNSRRLRHERDIDERFLREHRVLARNIGRLVLARAIASTEPLQNTRQLRERLKRDVWSRVLKPYYIGPGDDPFDGPRPLSPFASLLRDGVEGNIRIQVERQLALLRRIVNDDRLYRYLTGPRPISPITEQRAGTFYDPFHRFVDPNGYRISDRVWRDAIDVRSRVDRLLDYHISRGTAAVDIAEELEGFLTTGARLTKTRTPYGTKGSYAARRLARTEVTAAAGRATINSSIANPFVTGIRWALSASHPCCDICDDYAAGGPNGDGVYPPEEVPSYPAHPHDLCNLQPVATGDRAQMIEQLRADIAAARPQARRMRGLFNPDFLVQALLTGVFNEAAEALV